MRVLFGVLFIASPLFAGAALISPPDRGYKRGYRLGGATGWPRPTKNSNAEYIHPTVETAEEESSEEAFGNLNLPNDDEFGGYSGSFEVDVLPYKSSNYENNRERNDEAMTHEDDIDFVSPDQDNVNERPLDDLFYSTEKDEREKQDLPSQEIDSLEDNYDRTDDFFGYPETEEEIEFEPLETRRTTFFPPLPRIGEPIRYDLMCKTYCESEYSKNEILKLGDMSCKCNDHDFDIFRK